MKRIFQYTAIALFLFSMVNCSSSSDDPGPELTEEEMQINRLAKTWSLGTVHYGGDDVTDRFDGFTLNMTKSKTYSSTLERGDYDFEPFKDTGSWDFKGDNLNVLDRNDGVEMDIVVTENSLKMNYLITESNGRLAGLGEYQFDLTTQ
jgi:hypothetical protein